MTTTEHGEPGGMLASLNPAADGHGWQTELARVLGVDTRTVRKWIAGDNPIPGMAVVAIQGLLKREAT